MKKYIISFVCLLLVCLLLSLHVAAANIEVGSMPFMLTDISIDDQIFVSSPYDDYYLPIDTYRIGDGGNSITFDYWLEGDVYYYSTTLGLTGYWSDPDSEFYNIYDFDVLYLNFTYSFYDGFWPYNDLDPILGGQYIDVHFSPYADGIDTYYDWDYAIEIDNGDGTKQIVYRIPNPGLFFTGSGVTQHAFDVYLQWDVYYDYNEPTSAYSTFRNDGIYLTKEFVIDDDPTGSETTSPDSGGSGSGDSGSGDSGDIPPSNVTVIVNKIDAVGNLLADLKQASIEQYELQATQNVLISQLPDKLKDMALGEVTRPNIPMDKLSGLQEKEDLLYDKSGQLLGDKNSVIDGDFNNYVKPATGNTSAAYDLFFERLFDIPWINKMVFISLWFGLGGFILRLGRKLN